MAVGEYSLEYLVFIMVLSPDDIEGTKVGTRIRFYRCTSSCLDLLRISQKFVRSLVRFNVPSTAIYTIFNESWSGSPNLA